MFAIREKKIENCFIFGPWGHFFDLSEKITEILLKSFFTNFGKFFRFPLRPIEAELDGEGGVHPPPPPQLVVENLEQCCGVDQISATPTHCQKSGFTI